MLSQSQTKHITSLKIKKFREENSRFIAEGHKLVMDLLNSEFQIAGIYASAEWIEQNHASIHKKSIPVFETLPMEMERITALSTPSPVLAVVNIPDHALTTFVPGIEWLHNLSPTLALALDDIRDPGNMGTMIRIADWFGIETILCSLACVDIFNPKVVQASMGSIARVKMVSCDLAGTISMLKQEGEGISVYGTFLEGYPVYSQPLSKRGIIVIGNESRGISSDLEPLITHKLYIPSFGSSMQGKAESLNASIATAIICSEFRRRSFT